MSQAHPANPGIFRADLRFLAQRVPEWPTKASGFGRTGRCRTDGRCFTCHLVCPVRIFPVFWLWFRSKAVDLGGSFGSHDRGTTMLGTGSHPFGHGCADKRLWAIQRRDDGEACTQISGKITNGSCQKPDGKKPGLEMPINRLMITTHAVGCPYRLG